MSNIKQIDQSIPLPPAPENDNAPTPAPPSGRPIDTAPIDLAMLMPEELAWLNEYHAKVYAELAPYLDEEEKKWLENATKAIK